MGKCELVKVVSDPASPLRDLATERRDGRGDSSDLNLQIVAEVASSWSQICQFWWHGESRLAGGGGLSRQSPHLRRGPRKASMGRAPQRLGVVAAGVVSTGRESSRYPLLKAAIRNSGGNGGSI
ncbi:LOW QUALITY PROTEIN: hypothetical protein YC2023_081746 [Brassica napus]